MHASDLNANPVISLDVAKPCDSMPTLKIPALEFATNLRGKILETKPMENYDAEYVRFVVRTTLTNVLRNVTSGSAAWNAKLNRWEGNLVHSGY